MEIWKRNLLILWFAQFFVMAAMSQVMPFLPLYLKEDLGVTNEQQLNLWAGVIFGANFLSAFIFSPIWGNLADKVGRKVMILRSGFGMAIITGAMGLVNSPVQLLILRLVNGMISGFIPASIALVSTNTPKERVGFALGTLQSGAVAGSILGPALGGIMADYMGYRNIFFVTGTFLFIAALLTLVMVKEINKPNPKAKNGEGFVKDFKRIVSNKPIPALFGTGMILQFSLISTQPIMALYVEEIMDHPEHIAFFAGLVMSTTGVANMISAPILGKLGDRYGSQHVLFFSLLAASIVMLPHAFVTSIWQLLVLRFFLGLFVGGLMPSINALIRQHAPEGMESRTYGYSNSAMFIGNMMGPIIGGLITGWFDKASVFIFASMLLFMNFFLVRFQILGKVNSNLKAKHS
jgi:DHA1 family multidrug resistance protein-like MFS transporter